MRLITWSPAHTTRLEYLTPCRGSQQAGEKKDWVPAADIAETPEAYEVTVELPGVHKKDVGISVEDNVLTVTGEKKTGAKGFYLNERRTGRFSRRFYLPKYTDAEKLTAECRNGILAVTVPKSEAGKRREIEVK